MSFEQISWVFVALSMAGNIFVVKKNVIGQWLWAISNIGWVAFDLYINNYSQAVLFAFYMCTSIWGIIAWTKDSRKNVTKPA